jgi:para-aminobenzoate synthetase/4-amino-4-deoxychorismate lyase
MAAFNVAIRTLTIRGSKGVLNVGSGVVADSVAENEYAECLLKAQFLIRPEPDFVLIETLLWERGQGFALAEAHDERLADSAAYFGFPHDALAIQAVLDAAVARYGGDRARVRLLLHSNGELSATVSSLPAQASEPEWLYEIAHDRINSRARHSHHKTTRRERYDDALRAAAARGIDEVVFLNEHGDVAEGARSTVFIQQDDKLLTPPLSAGALNGCLRRSAIDRGLSVIETRLTVADLEIAQAVWFGNAVRGFIRGRRSS